jgi:tetratricopeptide (TPR) repeat protein
MKFLTRRIYLILVFLAILSFETTANSKDNKILYVKADVSNYFSGILFSDQYYTEDAFKRLNKAKNLKNRHTNYNIHFIRTLVLLEKFDQAIAFSKNIWREDILLFEADLLIGLDYFIKKDYLKAEKYFKRLKGNSDYELFFEGFLSNILLSLIKFSNQEVEKGMEIFEKIPNHYNNLKKIQNVFLLCHLDDPKTHAAFKELVDDARIDYSRYNFFLINYLLFKNKNQEVQKVIDKARKAHNSNLLIKQTEKFIIDGEDNKIKKIFNCKNSKDIIAEFFYIIANIYAVDTNYQLSNFFLKISLFLNSKFIPNKSLLAENYFYQKKYELSKNVYNSLKVIGSAYSWHASLSYAVILSDTKGEEYSASSLQKEFDLLTNPSYEHFYEIANFYKDSDQYSKSIKYYTLALESLSEDHHLIPKILDRRGTSYERLGEWEKAEKDLLKSLELLPDQPFVLNYLAYSWIDNGRNIDEAIKMLKKATGMREDSGYIIDSLGWAYYVNKNYLEAEKYLQRAVELMPLDPVINDHYADVLWMLEKNIQARYFWKHVLSLDDTEMELKTNIRKKIIFGVEESL